ncbi:hypothetical protein [Streptomyces sp. MUM 203J]|uniref:hypothetical protein n=1 Tax=Streptomyces sp. MUM 203J TaxID=2791990 RepID=UPI0027E54920|nr:hypothetical protein [Streptomyces sp. MUM 203J]
MTEGTARAAAGLRGHIRAIDATVTEPALRRPGPVAMLMQDLDDVFRLCCSQIGLIGL